MSESIIFRQAIFSDIDQVNKLYNSVKGNKYSVWNEHYPSIIEIKEDLRTNNLFVLENNNIIIGATSIVPYSELDDFECWKINDESHVEIARVVISNEFQNKKLSYLLIENIINELCNRNKKSIHLSVEVNNIPAYKLYLRMGFTNLKTVDLYSSKYYLMEKLLGL